MKVCRASGLAMWATVAAMLVARDARGQSSPIVPSTRVIVAGPASLYPQIALREAGSDSNVHNDSANPKSDLRYSLTPRLYAHVPVGNTRFVGTATGDIVYYRTYEDQRSVTLLLDGRYEVTSPGLRPFIEVGFANRGERVGFEIDARARHTQTSAIAGTDYDVTAITALTVWVGHSATAYEEDDRYLSFLLADQLNHTRDIGAAGARFRVTPLTTLLVAAEFERDRFSLTPLRDTDSWRVAPTVAFEAGAVITGDLTAGVRVFTPRDPAIAGYRGLVGSARLHYALPRMVRIDVEANRDVAYSYDPTQPYYLESGGRVTVAQRIVGPFEAIGIGERREIRNQRIGGTSFDGRREVTTSLGGGVGFQIQTQMRFALTYELTERTSTEPVGRDYERTRVLGSINYGL